MFNRGVFGLAMEDDDQDNVEVAVVEPTDLPEHDLLEVGEAEGQVAAVDASVDEAVQTADTIDDMADSLAESTADGGDGISEPTAEILETTMEHFRQRLGMSKKVAPKIATEAFGKKASRRDATIALESTMRETVKKIWDKIVAAFTSAIDWVKKFFAGVFNTAIKLKNRADAILKKAGESGAKGAEGEVNIGEGSAKLLRKGGTVQTGAGLVSAYAEVCKTSSADIVNFAGGLDAIGDAVQKAMYEAERVAAAGSAQGFNSAVSSVMSKLSFGSAAGGDAPEGMEKQEKKLALGDLSLFALVPKADAKLAEAGKVKVWLEPSSGAKDGEVKGAVPALSLEEVKKVAQQAANQMASYDSFKSKLSAVEKMQKDIISGAKDMTKNAEKESVANSGQMLAGLARSVLGLSTASLTAIRGYDLKVTKAALDYAAASLTGGKAEEKKEEPKKEEKKAA